jgi:hypothetical protein
MIAADAQLMRRASRGSTMPESLAQRNGKPRQPKSHLASTSGRPHPPIAAVKSRRLRTAERVLTDHGRLALTPLTPAAVIRRIVRQGALDVRLAPTHRWMQRWAVSITGGSPLPGLARIDAAEARSRFPPLTDEEAVITDKVVLQSPYRWPEFIEDWYRSDIPAEDLGPRYGIARTQVYVEHKIILGYLLGQLLNCGLHIPAFPGL